MARRSVGITLAGGAAFALILGLGFGTVAAVLWHGGAGASLSAADWAAVRFTIWQAVLSATFSVGLAIPVARALARRKFAGRGLIVTLLGAPFILPVIVAVMGLLAVFGRNGILSAMLGWVGLPHVQIYGLHGVVLAHVFFNLPLATRLILQGWLAIPAERFRLAASLNMGPPEIFRVIEMPLLRSLAPGAFLLIFLICLTSFAVALTLGGGPRATTVELAIYQAFRFDFDLSKAVLLAILQFVIGALAVAAALTITVPKVMAGGLDRTVSRFDVQRGALRVQDAALLIMVTVFVASPILAVTMRGLMFISDLPVSVWMAAGRSLGVALAATALLLVLSLPLALWITRLPARGAAWVEGVIYLGLAASPLVIGTGLFLIINPFVAATTLALPVTILVNAGLALPFALRALVPAIRDIEQGFGRLADSLDMTGWARLRLLVLPRLRRPLGFALGLGAALSMGDLGVIALFSVSDNATLPLQIYRLMGSYQMDAAAGATVVLLALTLTLFWSFDQGGRVRADT